MRTKTMISMMMLGIAIFTSCEKTELDSLSPAATKSIELSGNFTDPVFTTTIDDLTQADIDALMKMREEEKMARDVYDFFYEAYGLQVFDQISASEEQHTAVVLSLIEYFGLTDPAQAEAGVFNNSDIQELFNQLISAGTSLETALSTGAFIEEYDIADLQELISSTDNADIQRVYNNLLNGSYQHLKAFVRNLSSAGISYEPQILSAEDYSMILATKNGNNPGYGSSGNGKGKNNGSMQGNSNGTPVDADGDGICDVTGLPVGQNSGSAGQGSGGNGHGGNH